MNATRAHIDRFWAKVRRGAPDECWEWTAGLNNSGYGWFRGPDGPVGAHRFAYELAAGPIADDLHVLHSCDNRRCVNVAHLSLGTNSENVAEKMARGRHPNSLMTQCRNGHPFDEENTYIAPRGNRMCRTCNRLAQQRYEQRKREAAGCLD